MSNTVQADAKRQALTQWQSERREYIESDQPTSQVQCLGTPYEGQPFCGEMRPDEARYAAHNAALGATSEQILAGLVRGEGRQAPPVVPELTPERAAQLSHSRPVTIHVKTASLPGISEAHRAEVWRVDNAHAHPVAATENIESLTLALRARGEVVVGTTMGENHQLYLITCHPRDLSYPGSSYDSPEVRVDFNNCTFEMPSAHENERPTALNEFSPAYAFTYGSVGASRAPRVVRERANS